MSLGAGRSAPPPLTYWYYLDATRRSVIPESSHVASWLSVGADILSVVGFAITLWVAWTIREIRKAYAFKGRMPAFVERLDQLSFDMMTELYSLTGSKQRVAEVFASLESVVHSLRRTVPFRWSRRMKPLHKKLRKYDVINDDRDQAHEIFFELQKCREDVKNLKEEADWLR